MRKNSRKSRPVREQLLDLQLGFGPGSVVSRGQIYYIIGKIDAAGSEQAGERPVVIVSNNELNRTSGIVEVVPLTTRDKHPLPTHVPISSAKEPSTALCEQIQTVNEKALCQHIGDVSREEMEQIHHALMVSIGLDGIRSMDDTCIPNGTIRRGEIYALGGTRKPGEKVLIVSNNVGNRFSTIVEVLCLVKGVLEGPPTYVPIKTADPQFTVLCGGIQTIDKSRLGRRVGIITVRGMAKINHALAEGLGLLAEGNSAKSGSDSSAVGEEAGSKVSA